METAEEAATNGAYEEARFWLDFAREIREDAQYRATMAATFPRPAPEKESWFEAAGGTARLDSTQKLTVPEPRPGDASEALGRCKWCGYFVAGPIETRVPWMSGYVHTRTGDSVCPVSFADGMHHFAELETVDTDADRS